jgi:hypothetical protein
VLALCTIKRGGLDQFLIQVVEAVGSALPERCVLQGQWQTPVCVPVVKKTLREGGNPGEDVHSGEGLRSRKHRRWLEAVFVDSGPLARVVADPGLYARAGKARVDEGRVLPLPCAFPRVRIHERPVRILVQRAKP